jgi:hypothetical protein
MYVEGPWRMTWAEYGCRTGEFSAPGFDDSQWIADCARRPDCGGILIWNLADAWPQMSDAAIAWPFHVKKAYAAVKESFAAIGRR